MPPVTHSEQWLEPNMLSPVLPSIIFILVTWSQKKTLMSPSFSVSFPNFQQPKETELSLREGTEWARGKDGCHSHAGRGFRSAPPKVLLCNFGPIHLPPCASISSSKKRVNYSTSQVDVRIQRKDRSTRVRPPAGSPHTSVPSLCH